MKTMLTAALAMLLLAGCATAPNDDYQPGDALRMHREWFGPMSNVEAQRLHRGCTLPPLVSNAPPTTLTSCQQRGS